MRNLTQEEAYDLYELGVCPFCSRVHFMSGPRGGMSTNIECSACGARFNVLPVELGRDTGWGQVIGEPTREPPPYRPWWQFWKRGAVKGNARTLK
jgi:hypothetical protein